MKNALLLVLAMLFIGTAAYAGYPYVGLYAGIYDPDTGIEGPGGYDHSACGVTVSAPYTDIEMWIWWLPDPARGLAGGEFNIVYPPSSYLLQRVVTCNPGDLCFRSPATGGGWFFVCSGVKCCQYDWYWSHHQTLTILQTTPGTVQIVADPGLPTPPFAILVASCELSHPMYACTKLNDLAINQSVVAVQGKTWGAIKSLYQ